MSVRHLLLTQIEVSSLSKGTKSCFLDCRIDHSKPAALLSSQTPTGNADIVRLIHKDEGKGESFTCEQKLSEAI